MDPLSVAASIVGLLVASGTISSTLNNFIQNTKSAPKLAQQLLTEVIDLSACLSQVQALLSVVKKIPRSHQSLIMVEDIVVVLSNCVMTFSELEHVIDWLKPDQPMPAGKFVKWVLKEQSIGALLLRLQSSKTSLSLMIATFTSNSVVEAQSSVNHLTTLVQQILESNSELSQRLALMELKPLNSSSSKMDAGQPDNVEDDGWTILTTNCAPADDSLQRSSDACAIPEMGFSFEMDLRLSRPYTRVLGRPDDFSAASSAINTISWSCLSSLSMADVSNISVIGLPIDRNALWNRDRYDFKRPTFIQLHTTSTAASKDKIALRNDTVFSNRPSRLGLSNVLNGQNPGSDSVKQALKERPSYEFTAPPRKILLLVGSSSSGKTTISKHAQILHGHRPSKQERLQWRETILDEMITAVMEARQEFVNGDIFGPSSRELLQRYTEYFDILALATHDGQLDPAYSETCHEPLKSLWESQRMRYMVERGPNSALNEGIAYFLDHIDELFLSDDVVSDRLMLKARQITTGIHSNTISIGKEAIEIVDVGGRRPERKKWVHCPDVNRLVFVVALTGYSESLREENTTCQMFEDLRLFESVANHEKFSKLPIMLIFNKVDLFINLIRHVPVQNTFKDYNGGDNPKEAIRFLEEKFRQHDRRPHAAKMKMPLKFHVTDATDGEFFAMTMKVIHSFLGDADEPPPQDQHQQGVVGVVDQRAISNPIPISSTLLGF